MMTVSDDIREMCEAAKIEGDDPVELVIDYFAERDSRISRDEAKKMIERCTKTIGA